jgi:hypothetical protein
MPDELVTERICHERHENLEQKLTNIEHKLDNVCKMLIGNGEMGLCGKMSILWGVTGFLTIAVVTRLIVWALEFLPR